MNNYKIREIAKAIALDSSCAQGEFKDRVLAIIPYLTSDPWQPIETAPKDDKALYGYWTQFDNWYTHLFTGSHEPTIYGYTHWQPLPDPPKLSSTLDAATKITMVDITNLKTTMKNQDR
jgi:hypothetical protein